MYVIVIARGRGFMAVNCPSLRAQPEDKVGLHCHKSLATRAVTIIYTRRELASLAPSLYVNHALGSSSAGHCIPFKISR